MRPLAHANMLSLRIQQCNKCAYVRRHGMEEQLGHRGVVFPPATARPAERDVVHRTPQLFRVGSPGGVEAVVGRCGLEYQRLPHQRDLLELIA